LLDLHVEHQAALSQHSMDDIGKYRLPVKILFFSNHSDEQRRLVGFIWECIFIKDGDCFCGV